MRMGYDRLFGVDDIKKEKLIKFKHKSLDKVVIEPWTPLEIYPLESHLTRMLNTMEKGDTLVIQRLESISESPIVWEELLQYLMRHSINLEVYLCPSLTTIHWGEIIKYWQPAEVDKRERNRIISVNKESRRESKRIRGWSADTRGREMYWRIFKELNSGAALRDTSRRMSTSQGTILRIKRDVIKLKQTTWLVSTFGITIASLKMAQAYSTNWFLQVIICGVATIMIIYLSYSDIKNQRN